MACLIKNLAKNPLGKNKLRVHTLFCNMRAASLKSLIKKTMWDTNLTKEKVYKHKPFKLDLLGR